MQRKDVIKLEDYKVPNYLIDKTKLCFKLDEEKTEVESVLAIHKNPDSKETDNDLILNGENIALDSVALNGKKLTERDYQITDSTLTIKDVPNAFKLKIKSHLNPKENKKQAGLYVTKGQLCTFCEPEGFRRITYFLDRPDVQSTYETKLIADQKQYPILLSNGTLIAKGKLKNGKHWTTWNDPIKKPSYLFAVVAGQFDCFEDSYTTKSGRDIKLKIYVDKGKGDQCAFAMGHLKNAMRWDEDNYGRECELNEYKLIGVNDFKPAADENVGMNIFRQEYLTVTPENASASSMKWAGKTIAHEYFHHWSGNRVTIRDWFQISLKEGLTRFRDQSYNIDGGDNEIERIEQADHLELYLRSGYAIRPASYPSYKKFQKNATTEIYAKGAEFFRMLQTVLGKPLFRQCLEHYFDSNRGRAATFEDFIKAFEHVSKQDLSQYLLWISQRGTPKLEVTRQYNPEEKTYTLKFKQDTHGQKPVPIPVKMALFDDEGQSIPLDEDKTIFEKVLVVKDEVAEFQFKNIASKPIPSLLRDYSAPVAITYWVDEDELRFLLKHETNAFCRWRAGKQYIEEVIGTLHEEYKKEKKLILPKECIATIRHLLKNKTENPGIIAKILKIEHSYNEPSLAIVKEFFQDEVAQQLKSTLMRAYNRCQAQEVNPHTKELENILLSYLNRKKDHPKAERIIHDNFLASFPGNLSDSLEALELLINQSSEFVGQSLTAFHKKWKDDPKVLEELIRMIVKSDSPDTAKLLEKGLSEKWIDINNAGHIDALTWFIVNLKHSFSLQGLAFLERLILQLDSIKPKSAVDFFRVAHSWGETWGEASRPMIAEQFKHILQHAISDELKIAVSKALSIKPEVDFSHKTNRQIHLLLSKQGIFSTSANLRQESSKQSCQLENKEYIKYAENLAIKSMK